MKTGTINDGERRRWSIGVTHERWYDKQEKYFCNQTYVYFEAPRIRPAPQDSPGGSGDDGGFLSDVMKATTVEILKGYLVKAWDWLCPRLFTLLLVSSPYLHALSMMF